LYGFSNCYLVGSDFPDEDSGGGVPREVAPREAIIVDPGSMDKEILLLIENSNYRLRGVLITHNHLNHVHGLRTLMRIYHTEIFAADHIIQDHRTSLVKDGDVLTLGPFRIEVISIPGHSPDSVVYKIKYMLFTGDVLNAGLVGTTASSYGAALQMTAIRNRLFSLPGNYAVLPGHGPPSTLDTERRLNAGVEAYEQNKKQRPLFSADIW
jgi:glyoxylase-like metal-dependent hydrolase (beta-lactamase superfamily II)